MSDWAERQQRRELHLALDAVTLLATERIASMRGSCKARPSALRALAIVNDWVARERWPE